MEEFRGNPAYSRSRRIRLLLSGDLDLGWHEGHFESALPEDATTYDRTSTPLLNRLVSSSRSGTLACAPLKSRVPPPTSAGLTMKRYSSIKPSVVNVEIVVRRQILRGHAAVSTSARRPGGRIDRGRATGLPVAPIRLRRRQRTNGPRTPTDLREDPRTRSDVQDADESLASWTRHRIGLRQRHRRRITGAPARFACPFLEPRTGRVRRPEAWSRPSRRVP